MPAEADHTKDWVADFVIGGVSAGVAKTIVAPIERVKLVLQIQHISSQISKKYTGIGDAFVRITKEEGFLSLYRGNLANVIRYFPTQAFNFAFKETFEKIFNKGVDKKKQYFRYFLGDCLSGGTAGTASLCLVYPLDYARTRLAADMGKKGDKNRQYTGMIDVITKTVKQGGPVGLYRGFLISAQGIFLYRAAYFGINDGLKRFVFGFEKVKDLAWGWAFALKFCVAQIATNAAGFVAFPMDTVRRRLMMQSGLPPEKRKYKNTLDCFKKITKEEGGRAFFKGGLSNIIRGIGGALVLALNDEFQALWAKHKNKKKSD